MKKTFSLVASLMLSGVALAAANDAMISFSTPGTDTYADGSAVLDGECYALVWSSGGAVTIAADGTAAGGEIVLVAPVAKNGRCPRIFFEVDANDIETKYRGGTWSVYLLDTRTWGANGSVRPAGTVSGRVRLVNAASPVAAKVGVATSSSSTAVAAAGAVASGATAVPEGTPAPVVTGIRVDGANVYVTVKGTVPYLQYDLSSGATPDAVAEHADRPQAGAETADEEIILVAPAKKGSGFFKVGRR